MANAFYDKALEKMLSTTGTLAITDASNESPIKITTGTVPHGLANGDRVTIVGVGGNTNANVYNNLVTVVNANEFTLDSTTGNANYTTGGEVLLTSALLKKSAHIIRWGVDDIKVMLVNTVGGYSFSASHEFLSSIDLSDRLLASGNLSGKTFTGGIADAADLVFSAVPANTIEAFVIYKDTGDVTTSSLIAYFDVSTGLPVTSNGGDITIAWDNGTNKIFRI